MKLKILCTSLLALVIVIGCQQDKKSMLVKTLPVPAFEIKLALAPRAERELKKRNETIVIFGSFSGTPTKESGIKDNDPTSGYTFGSFKKELNIFDKELIAQFDNLTIPEYIFNALKEKDYNVYIGVRTGWKSTKFDLLECDYFEKVISQVRDQQHILKCELIRDPNVKLTGISYLVSLDEMAKYTKAQAFDRFIHQIGPLVIDTLGDYSKPAVLLITFNCTPNGQTVNIESQAIPKKFLRNLYHKLAELPKLETTGNISFRTTYEITP